MAKYIDAEKIPFVTGQTQVSELDYVRRYVIARMPAADVVEVVRCKNCKYGDTGTDEIGRQFYKCIGIHYGSVSPTDYCSYGEREDD